MRTTHPIRCLVTSVVAGAVAAVAITGCSAGVTDPASTTSPAAATTPTSHTSSPLVPSIDVSVSSEVPTNAATGTSSPPASTTPGAGTATLPDGFPLPPGATVDGVTHDDHEIAGRVTVTDGTQAFAFWKQALPAAGYPVTSADGAGGLGEIRFSGHGCTGNSQIALTGSTAAVQCDLG